jgi:hypothetical protein
MKVWACVEELELYNLWIFQLYPTSSRRNTAKTKWKNVIPSRLDRLSLYWSMLDPEFNSAPKGQSFNGITFEEYGGLSQNTMFMILLC